MQWCEQLPHPEQIPDPAHAQLFETEFLRATSLAVFKSEVLVRLRALKDRQEKEKTAAEAIGPSPTLGRKLVFIDDLASQPALSDKLRATVRGANCDIRSLPPGAPLGNNCRPVDELAAELARAVGRELTEEERRRFGVPEAFGKN